VPTSKCRSHAIRPSLKLSAIFKFMTPSHSGPQTTGQPPPQIARSQGKNRPVLSTAHAALHTVRICCFDLPVAQRALYSTDVQEPFDTCGIDDCASQLEVNAAAVKLSEPSRDYDASSSSHDHVISTPMAATTDRSSTAASGSTTPELVTSRASAAAATKHPQFRRISTMERNG
jgi:hypothetical protein